MTVREIKLTCCIIVTDYRRQKSVDVINRNKEKGVIFINQVLTKPSKIMEGKPGLVNYYV